MNARFLILGLALSPALTLGLVNPVEAQISDNVIRIGFISDLSGPYSDMEGAGGLEAVRMAVADVGGEIEGKRIEVVFADHQNRADIASSKAREWLDHGVDVIIGGPHSSAMLAINKLTGEKKIPFFVTAAVTPRFTNEDCTPYTVHYAHDSVALAKVAGTAMVNQGFKSWYFLTVDNAGGIAIEQDTANNIAAKGGKKLGASRHPLNASDFSSFIAQAVSSRAQVLALANAGADTFNSVKAAKEFGALKSMKLTALLTFINDVHALGLETAQGMYVTEGWYWDQNAQSRAWSERFNAKMKKMPTAVQAADYSAISNYLKAVQAVGSDDGDKVMARLKEVTINDMFTSAGVIRPDGRLVHDMYLMQVKTPSESKYPWDYLKLIQTVPGEQAFASKAESRCIHWK